MAEGADKAIMQGLAIGLGGGSLVGLLVGYLLGAAPWAGSGLQSPECLDFMKERQRELEFVSVVCDLSLNAALGERIDWPAEHAATFSASTVQAALTRAAASCPELAAAEPYADCDEFPCILWTQGTTSLEECAAFDLNISQPGNRWVHGRSGKNTESAQWVIAPDGWPAVSESENWEIRRDFRLLTHERLVAKKWNVD